MSTTASPLRLRPASARGTTRLGWLESRHSFQFGDYADPLHPGFHSLRVINDDRVAPGGGFPSHPHRDMEIFSYVLSGRLEHTDSLGHSRVLHPGEIQLMRAGRGIVHSEKNPSSTEPVRFLQIWIQPSARGLEPAYTEWKAHENRGSKILVISPDGREGTARIAQDAFVYRLRLAAGESVTHAVAPGRAAWLQIATGTGHCNSISLQEGDGLACEAPLPLDIGSTSGLEALLFDLTTHTAT